MAAGTQSVTLDDVLSARRLLTPVIGETPLAGSRWLTERLGAPVWFKCENLQRTGSFKIRGAYVRIARLSDAERARGVVAASAGNHAQGVALAAGLLGTKATVFMPYGAPIVKEHATRGYGADVRFAGTRVDDCLAEARAFAQETGAVLIHPFDHADIVAGQGTVGLEILEQCPDVRTIFVGTGGGGLLAGIAVAVKALNPEVRLVGVQAERVSTYEGSLAAGSPVALQAGSTMADGIAVYRPGDVPFALVRDLVDQIVTVSEESLSEALLLLLERAKQVVEPAGAAGVAALLEHPETVHGTSVAVLSGGNVDPLLLMRVLRHGLGAAGRFLSFRVRVSDHPGALARLLGELAVAEANVVDVAHERTGPHLLLDEVGVVLAVETRGNEHATAVLAHLAIAGYDVRPLAD